MKPLKIPSNSKLFLSLKSKLLNRKDAKAYLGISERTLCRWGLWNVIPVIYWGSEAFYHLEDISWIRELSKQARRNLVGRCRKIFLTKQKKRGRPIK